MHLLYKQNSPRTKKRKLDIEKYNQLDKINTYKKQSQ